MFNNTASYYFILLLLLLLLLLYNIADTKNLLGKAMVESVVYYGCESMAS